MGPSDETATKPLRITSAELHARLREGEAATLFDVRNQDAWARSTIRIPGSVRPDHGALLIDPAWSRDRLLVAY